MRSFLSKLKVYIFNVIPNVLSLLKSKYFYYHVSTMGQCEMRG